MSDYGVGLLIVLVIAAILLAVLAAASVTVVQEYQRGVVLTLGRFSGIRSPGLRFVIPVLQRMHLVDIREKVVDIQPQEIITKDNVLVRVNGVVYYRVHDPRLAILDIEDFNASTREMAQASLRASVGSHELDELSDPERLNVEIQRALEVKTESWGIKVSNVEVKEVEVDKQMIRHISRQAEAERMRRAKVIEAEGELQAAEALLQAAQMLAQSPEAMQLRYLATLGSIANERSSTIVFPFPTDLAQMLGTKAKGNGSGNGSGGSLT
ncbi:MAG: SPFH domain-containing protein [Alphaproteobacteria bacterium]|nr:SPFH domain-containing protein [Alphaproteobacteria bacterium]